MSLIKDMFPNRLVYPGSKRDPEIDTMSRARGEAIHAAVTVRGAIMISILTLAFPLRRLSQELQIDWLDTPSVIVTSLGGVACFLAMLLDIHRLEALDKMTNERKITVHLYERVAFALLIFMMIAYFLFSIFLLPRLVDVWPQIGLPVAVFFKSLKYVPWVSLACLMMAYGASLRWKAACKVDDRVAA